MTASERLPRILLVDDEAPVRETLAHALSDCDYVVRGTGDARQALEWLRAQPFDLLITDLRMPDLDGLALLAEVRRLERPVQSIVVTAFGDVDHALQATRLGAYDFLCKPIDARHFRLAVARAVEHQRLVSLNQRLSRQLAHPPAFAGLVGQSPPMLEVFRLIAQVARTQANVLITGESGTGKEQVARAIHAHSARKDRRFTIIDCAAIPESLIESVLFGHRKGAFTGAAADHPGLLGLADGGTVFFDEIGELPLALQSRLLRLIQERVFTPVGADQEVAIDIRVLAATNRDLKTEAREGRFREDLYYRLNVIPLRLPSLRERSEDIEPLVWHFLDQFAEAFPAIRGIEQRALDALSRYDWPGNVRELRNAVERAVSLAAGALIDIRDLPEEIREAQSRAAANSPAGAPRIPDWDTWLRNSTREYLARLMTACEGNVSRAAEQAGMARKVLYRLFRDAGLSPEDFR